MTAIHLPLASLVSPILNADIRFWAWGVLFWFLWILGGLAEWFIRCRDVGPPRMRIDSVTCTALAMIAACRGAWAVSLFGLVALAASVWLGSRALRKDWAWERHLNRDWGDCTVLIVPDLSRRLAWECPLFLPRVCLDRLSDPEVDALLARQVAAQSRWLLKLSLVIPLCAATAGLWAVPPSLAPLVAIAGVLCFWALTVWVFRRLDARADAKAIQATGDPATYIQALVKADGIMKEIPRRLRMSTWWLFPASLEARIGAIERASGAGPERRYGI